MNFRLFAIKVQNEILNHLISFKLCISKSYYMFYVRDILNEENISLGSFE